MKLTPRSAPEDDKMFNRRLLAYYGLIFTVYWAHLTLFMYILLLGAGREVDAATVIAFLGVPGSLAGLGFWKYLKAAEKDDDKQSEDNSGIISSLSNAGLNVESGELEVSTSRTEKLTIGAEE